MTPAVTPSECEACGNGDNVDSDHAADLHARIRELVGLVREASTLLIVEFGENPYVSWQERAEAALARSEGGT